MPALTPGGLLTRLRPPADAGADADLLCRFVRHLDADAFADIVRRHGAMVLAVCRRVLGDGPDADDAHQIAFMALARDAAKIATPAALGGWLYRVAWLSARKLAGRVHRRKPEPLTTDPARPMPTPPDRDVRAVIDEELLALPERFRAVAVLCLVEGRTNTEAAGLLGIPKGTVDSRLSTAKAKLRERLLRRGVAAAAVLTAEHLLTSETTAAATRAAALAANAITVALDYAAGVPTAGTEHLLHTANGVKPVTSNLKWLAVTLFGAALLGGSGVGVYVATAGEKDKPADTKKPDEKPADKPDELVSAKRGMTKTAYEVNEALKAKVEWGTLTDVKLGEFLELVSAKTGVTVRVDTAAFVRRGLGAEQASIMLLDRKLIGSGKPPAMFCDLLREALARAANPEIPDLRLSYRIKGSEILIVPEYQPPTVPGSGAGDDRQAVVVPMNQLIEDLYGEPVTVRYKKKSLADVVEDLQDRTGANIVLNVTRLAEADADKMLVTANFNDTRLLTVLKIVGDMYNLKPVVVDNVFYLTDPESALRMQAEVNRDLFGIRAEPKK